jgi:hypothetical protein
MARVDQYKDSIGSILVDPKTGKRTLIEPSEPAQPSNPDSEVTSDAASEAQNADSGKD